MSVPRMNRLNRLTVNIGYNKQALVETTQVPKQAQSNTCLLACLGYNCAGTEATVLELELELELELDRIWYVHMFSSYLRISDVGDGDNQAGAVTLVFEATSTTQNQRGGVAQTSARGSRSNNSKSARGSRCGGLNDSKQLKSSAGGVDEAASTTQNSSK